MPMLLHYFSHRTDAVLIKYFGTIKMLQQTVLNSCVGLYRK